MDSQAPNHTTATVRIVLIYALFGLAWIYGSDTVVGWLVQDHAVLVNIALVKGSLFIFCTAALLFFLIRRFAAKVEAAEKRELESLKGYQAIFNATNEAIFVHDSLTGRVLDVNDRMLEMYGCTRAEVPDIDPASLCDGTPPYSKEDAHDKLRKAVEEGPQVFEWRSRRKNGGIFWSEVSLKRVVTADYDRIIAVVRDISERKLLESQLHQSQKMESIGRLAGGVAHDFNNMLSVILGYTQLSLMKLDEEDPYREVFQQIFRAAERSSEITRQLLAFSRKEVIEPRPLNLNHRIEEAKDSLGRLIGEDVRLTFRAASPLWTVRADPSQIDQILMNLAVNARDAMPNGGTLTIETSNVHISRNHVALYPDAHPGDYVLMTVSDTGVGMDRKTQLQIFEPFFTTKRSGDGTGLGLATVYGIVTQNNGFISCYSEPGQGTVFRVYLPRHLAEEEVDEATEPLPLVGHGTILLVEDEEMLLKMTTEMLEAIGYQVIQAGTPDQAIAICKGGEKFDLILTDVVMPGMNGREMIDKIKSLHPEVKVVFMSGYTADIVAQRGIVDKGMHYVQKPLDLNELSQKVLRALVEG